MHQHLEDQLNSVNHYFLNDMMLKNQERVKGPLKVKDKAVDFNVTGYEKFINVDSDRTFQKLL